MSTHDKKYDILAIDNCLIDQFYRCDQGHPETLGLESGVTHFPDDATVQRAIHGLPRLMSMAGGGSANSIAQMQRHGARTAFSGVLGQSPNADAFRSNLAQSGIDLYEIPSDAPDATGSCTTLLTPDRERTMLTRLPGFVPIDRTDMDRLPLTDSAVVMTQAYLWSESTRDALAHAFATTRAAGGKVAFSLSAPRRVTEFRDDIEALIHDQIDILFGNEKEFGALFPGKSIPDIVDILTERSQHEACGLFALTLGGEGSILIDHGTVHRIPTVPVPEEKILDKTGAGDAYAGGVLYGLTHGLSTEASGQLGAEWGAATIQHLGARPPAAPRYTVLTDQSVLASLNAPRVYPGRAA